MTMVVPHLKSTLERIVAGLESGEMKEGAAFIILQALLADWSANRNSRAYIRETLNAAWRRIEEQGRRPPKPPF